MFRTLITCIDGPLGSWLRYLYYFRRLKRCGGYFSSAPGFVIDGVEKVSIGRNCAFNRGVFIAASEGIEFGDDVLVGAYSIFRDAEHGLRFGELIRTQKKNMSRITIGNDVWIGSHAVILKGSNIGDGTVIGANSLVKRDTGKYGIWVGSPVKLMRMRE